jgi:hypothetical protein
MGYKTLFVDRLYQAGLPSKYYRRKGYRTGPERSHPMATAVGQTYFPERTRDADTIDYFRRALGRYYSFTEGDSRATLSDYTYLYPNAEPTHVIDLLASGGGMDTTLFIGAQIYHIDAAPEEETPDSIYPGGAAAANPLHWMEFCAQEMPGQLYETTVGAFPAEGDWEYDPGIRPLNGPIPNTDGTYENLAIAGEEDYGAEDWAPTLRYPPGRQVCEIYVSGNAAQWDAIANNSAVLPAFGELFDAPMYNTWKTYVLGSADPRLAGIPQADDSHMPGLLGPVVFGQSMHAASSLTPSDKAFWDHVFTARALFPKEDPARMSCQYNYFAPDVEAPQNPQFDSPLLLPNYYLLASVLEAGTPDNYIYSPAPSIPYGLYSDQISAQRMRDISGYFDALPLESPAAGRTVIYVESIDGERQDPDTYINRLGTHILGPNGALTTDQSNGIKKRMKHLGLSVKAKEAMAAMNSQTHIMPYGLYISFSDLEVSEVAQEYSDDIEGDHSTGRATTMREAFYDYFLFEIMKANIAAELAGTDWYPGVVGVHGGSAGDSAVGSSPPYAAQLYHTMSVTSWTTQDDAVTEAGEHLTIPRLGGEAPVFNGNDNYSVAGSTYWDRHLSTVKCIDVRNIFLHGIGKVTQNHHDFGTNVTYGLNWGTNGFIYQTALVGSTAAGGDATAGGVVGGEGLIIGRDVIDKPTLPPYNGNMLFGNGFMGPFEGCYLDFLETLLEVSKFNRTPLPIEGLPEPPQIGDGLTRTAEQLLAGQPAYADTVAYKITKYEQVPGEDRSGVGTRTPIQHIYVPANSRVLEYFDTQVEYGKSYFYEVSAYKLVFGNEYSYYNPNVRPSMYTMPYPSRIAEAILGMRNPAAPFEPWAPIDNITLEDYSSDTGVGGGANQFAYDQGWGIVPTEQEAIDTLRLYGVVAGYNQAYYGDSTATAGSVLRYAQAPENLATGQQQSLGSFIRDFEVAVDLGPPGSTSPVGFPDYTENYHFVVDAECSDEILRQRVFQSMYLTNPFPGQDSAPWSRYLSIKRACFGLNAGGLNPFMVTRFISSGDISTIFPDIVDPSLDPSTGYPVVMRGEGRFLLCERSILQKLTKNQKAHVLELLNHLNPNYLASITPGFDPMMVTDLNLAQHVFNKFFGILYTPAVSPIQVTELKWFDGPHGFAPEVPWDLDDAGTATVDMVNKSSIKLIEVPYWTSPTKLVHDLPPVPPDFNFFPTYGVNNKVKILMNQNSNHFEAPPIIIEATDQIKFDAIATTQERTDGLIEFGTDDSRLTFEVFRTTRKPSSYVDFSDSKRYAMEGRTKTGYRATNVALVDDIEPNQAYYYCFRVLDKGGYPSNPTPVTKVELIDENGRMYFMSEAFPMVAPPLGKPQKSFRKYLEIGAAMDHKLVTPTDPAATTAGLLDELPDCNVGDPASGFWNSTAEKFKVRITSKDTGRKIDLNLRFKLQPMVNPKLPEEN